MTDIHTHILPGMDDGARDVEESLAMLAMERDQGVDTVVLTPHFYPSREDVGTFLARRERALARLRDAMEACEQSLPEIRVGAEVAWRSDMNMWEHLDKLCMEGTQNLLLELPFTPWSKAMIDLLYDMIGRTGITPVIAHLERYISYQPKQLVREVLDLGVPVQVSSGILKHPLQRRTAMKLLKKGQAHLLASDCHGLVQRTPDLSAGMEAVCRKLGTQHAQLLCDYADELARR